ncbi:fumarate hydratase C-terminal domain-containing protein [Stutzerimonas azotifigens]|uniref:fumarate hydratase C-terminal domain-containing protein n=1 Tax=Stutzerimonas azotifigens TaxID=291995 RepID=UPI00042940F9|nr:fumarate hydratase C-terminal domain-containing protein [Stutzerimonas azotifigens]
MAHHDIITPIDDARARSWRVGDTVTLNGTLFGIRDATLIHMFDHGRRPRFDLAGHAVIHTAPNVVRVPPSAEHPAGYRPACIGTTTSARMERFTRPLLRDHGVRMIIGKGGLLEDSQAAFAEYGGVYLAIVGGAAALETTWIEAIEDVDMDDLHPESLWRFRVAGFGPLTVAMDCHGNSLYRDVRSAAEARRAQALSLLDQAVGG